MMDYETQLKVQAYLDNELPEAERHQLAERLSRDTETSALLQELANTSQSLHGHEAGLRLPESREFFWSKIEREIVRQDQSSRVREPDSILARLRRLLVPASAVALLALVLTLSIGHSSPSQPGEMELVSEEMGALTFRSQAERMTMVWLYPRSGQDTSDVAPIDFKSE